MTQSVPRVILSPMKFGGWDHAQSIQLLVNYWEVAPASMGKYLDALMRRGASAVTAFVPWQVFESDISHGLSRFLQAAAERHLPVSLVVTPELGVHYTNSGIPKDLLSNPENFARHRAAGPEGKDDAVLSSLPPNVFALPSLYAPDIQKRYQNFLSKFQAFLASMDRLDASILSKVKLCLTGSFWKYYRSAAASVQDPFAGPAGDSSRDAMLAFRRRLEDFYSAKEFAEPTPSAANRWKTRSFEEVNLSWFHQHSEDYFRFRTTQLLSRGTLESKLVQMELFTPEADPGMTYSNFLQAVSSGHGDFFRMSSMIDSAMTRLSAVNGEASAPFLHWTALGSFHRLTDAEKQFLILKSLLLAGGRGGGILIDEAEWFSLSPKFRANAEALARSLGEGTMRLRNRAFYLTPHLWAPGGPLWQELQRAAGTGARMISSVDLIDQDGDPRLLVVDPAMVMTADLVRRLTRWAAEGGTLAVPRSPLYTEAALAELDRATGDTRNLDIDFGIPYKLHDVGEGRVIVYELPEGIHPKGELASAWHSFIQGALGVADIREVCRFSDGRLSAVPLVHGPTGAALGLFVLNGTTRTVSADIMFRAPVTVSDLAITMSGGAKKQAAAPGTRFSLEVPPRGILPVSVEGVGVDADERRDAARLARHTRDSVFSAAASELPGFDVRDGFREGFGEESGDGFAFELGSE